MAFPTVTLLTTDQHGAESLGRSAIAAASGARLRFRCRTSRLDREDPRALIPAADEVVLAMGATAANLYRASGTLQQKPTLAQLRGKPARAGSGWVLVTHAPYTARELDHQAAVEISWDVSLAIRLATTGTTAPDMSGRVYRYAESLSGIEDWVKRRADETGRRVSLAEDLETVGLWPWYPDRWIVSYGLGTRPGRSVVIPFPTLSDKPSRELLRQIEWLENADEVSLCGANLKFDNVWKAVKWGLAHPTSFRCDSLLLGSLIDENRRNSLTMHAQIYAPVELGGYDAEMTKADKARMDLQLRDHPQKFLTYAGGDPDAVLTVRSGILDQARAQNLTDFYTQILHPAARLCERVELHGILVDADRLREVGEEAARQASAAYEEMVALTPGRVLMHRSKTSMDRIQFTEATLREIFFSPRGWGLTPRVLTEQAQLPSTAVDAHLKMFAADPRVGPFLEHLRRKTRAEKIKSTYVDGYLKHLRPDGRLHATFALYVGSFSRDEQDTSGTNTGRSATKDPNVQNIPKRKKPGGHDWAKAIRSAFPAPPGYLIGEADVAQGELKIHAMLSREPTMLRLFREGKDMHVQTAALSANCSYEEMRALKDTDRERYEFFRYGAKPQNFGLLYLQSPAGYQKYAYKQFDLEYTLDECEAIHSGFFGLYRGLERYAAEMQAQAQELGYVRNPLGRVRHLPLARSRDRSARARALRQAVNARTQSMLSDFALWGGVCAAEERCLLQRGVIPFNFVHDAWWVYFPDTSAGVDLLREWRDAMQDVPWERVTDWRPEIPLTVDLKAGPRLDILEDVS